MSYKYAIICVDALTIMEREELNQKLVEFGCEGNVGWSYQTDSAIHSHGDAYIFDKPVSDKVIQRDNLQGLNVYEREDKRELLLEHTGDEESEIRFVSKDNPKEFFTVKIVEHSKNKCDVKLELIVPKGYSRCVILPGFELRNLTVKDEEGSILSEFNSNTKNEYGSYIKPFLVSTSN